MSLEFEEIYAYTRDQVATHVNEAIEIVDMLQIPPDLRVAAFERAVALLSQKTKIPIVPEALKGIELGRFNG